MKTFLRILSLIFCTFIVFPAQAQDAAVVFPTVASSEYASLSGSYFSISNDATYVYLCAGAEVNCNIYDRSTGSVAVELNSTLYASWASDNSHLVAVEGVLPCEAPDNTPNLRIFDTATAATSTGCLPFAYPWLDWSPLDSSIFTIDDQTTFNLTDSSVTPYEPTATITADDLSTYVGYGAVLWDTDTNLPAALINLRRDVEAGSDQITSSVFEVCAMQLTECIPLVDTLTHSNADVFTWQLNGRWLLWAGHLSATGTAAVTGEDPTTYNDTVLFLTDMGSGTTQEIFRSSSLGQSGLYIEWNMSWSPDRNTVALLMGEAPSETPVAQPTLGPAPETRDMLILTLDWDG